jgi:hypothetical protein
MSVNDSSRHHPGGLPLAIQLISTAREPAAVLVAVLMTSPAFAQAERSWVDPPAISSRGSAQVPGDAPSNEVTDGAVSSTDRQLKRADAARQLMMDYLDFWSAPNALALEAMPRFYAQHVDFHGRRMSAEALFAEKRRFVRRWPVRSYTARIETLRATCAPGAQTCSVKVLFDFAALSPERGRRSQGAADLELQLSFAGERPDNPRRNESGRLARSHSRKGL